MLRIFVITATAALILIVFPVGFAFGADDKDPSSDGSETDDVRVAQDLPSGVPPRARKGQLILPKKNLLKPKTSGDDEEDEEEKAKKESVRKRTAPGEAVKRPGPPNSKVRGADLRLKDGTKTIPPTSRMAKQNNKPGGPPTPPPPRGGSPSSGAPGAPGAKPGDEAGASASSIATSSESDRKNFQELKPGEKYYIDYYDQDLIEFVKQMSEKFKVNFILSDKIKGGKITIISPNPVTREEAWQAFLSALASKELTLVRVGKFYKIISVRDAQREPIKTYLEGGTTDPSDEMITYLLKLKHIEIADIERILKDLKSKSGEIITFEPTSTMIITDTAINIRRMIKIVNELDLPGGRDAIHVIDIYYASAADIAEKLEQIFGEKGSKKTTTAKKTTRKKTKKGAKPEPAAADSTQVTLSNVIADERTNQLIIVAPRDAMPRILDMINRLDVPIPGDGQVHVYYLENANAEELASTLTGMAGRGASRTTKGKGAKGAAGGASGELFEGEVKITADKATNSLVIVASTKDYSQLKKVINQLDIPRRQVFVEAVIMEVALKKDHAFGIAANGGYTFDIGGEQVPLFAGTTLGTMSSVAMDPTTLSGLAVGLRGPDLEGTEGILGEGVSLPAFGVLLQALQTDSDANVLSTPHILTMDNEEAEIIVGSNVPFITGQARDSNNRPVLSIQRQDVALTMKIKPQINESDFVRLAIQQEITELASISETLGPTTTKRAAKSTVVVKDNQTIVIGGLLRDRQSNDADKVPVLGDIPIIGRLFRRDKELNEKTNLLIFLTPHIIKDEKDFKRIFKRKMEERNEFLRRFYGTDDDYEFELDYTQKVGVAETIRATYEKEKAEFELQMKEDKEIIIAPEEGHTAFEIGAADNGRSSSSKKESESDSKAAKRVNPDHMPTHDELIDKLIRVPGKPKDDSAGEDGE